MGLFLQPCRSGWNFESGLRQDLNWCAFDCSCMGTCSYNYSLLYSLIGRHVSWRANT